MNIRKDDTAESDEPAAEQRREFEAAALDDPRDRAWNTLARSGAPII